MNGVAWVRAEIDQLVSTVENGGCTLQLAERLGRTPQAVTAMAGRLHLKPPVVAELQRTARDSRL